MTDKSSLGLTFNICYSKNYGNILKMEDWIWSLLITLQVLLILKVQTS